MPNPLKQLSDVPEGMVEVTRIRTEEGEERILLPGERVPEGAHVLAVQTFITEERAETLRQQRGASERQKPRKEEIVGLFEIESSDTIKNSTPQTFYQQFRISNDGGTKRFWVYIDGWTSTTMS